MVHFHDIFLPKEYPHTWVFEKKIFWNEQYLVLAFSLFNKAFDALLGNAYLFYNHVEEVRRLFPYLPEFGGGSLWLRKVQ